MADASGLGYFAQAFGSYFSASNQANALEAQGRYAKRVSEQNAAKSSAAARNAESRGASAAARRQTETVKLQGAQRAALAAQGIDVDSEMAADIEAETEAVGAADVAAINVNAWREAWGFDSQASSQIAGAETMSLASQNTARNTMLTGSMDSLSYGLKGISSKSGTKESK